MKKIILSIVTITSLNAFSQDFSFGAKAGANMNLDKFDEENSIGFYAGGLAEYHLNQKMSVQAELLYNETEYQRGYLTYSFGNLSFPISYNYYFIDNLKVSAGFQFSYLIKSIEKWRFSDYRNDFDPGINQNDLEYNRTDNFNKFYTDFIIGASYKIWKGLFIDVRYNYGLNDIKEKKNLNYEEITDSNFSLKRNYIQLGLSYKF